MAEFKFSCPQCSQHIQCDTGYAGMQINCPSCNQAIVVPQPPHFGAAPVAPPAPPPGLATKQSTTVAATGRRFAGAPSLSGAPPPKPKSKALRNVLVITASIVVLAGLGAGGWFGFSKYKEHQTARRANPAAQVATPTANATVQALSILTKVHSAYTNMTSMTADGTFTLFLNLSNLTMADVSPGQAANANARTANRRPPGMPRTFALSADMTVKTAHTNWFYLAGEMVAKQDRQTMSNTFAIWSSDKGMFMFQDSHARAVPPTYQQLPSINQANNTADQVRNFQNMFQDPAQLTKIVKDLGQTADEPVNGQDCYTLTAKVLGQKVKLWVDKTSYQIPQWEITLGGAISDADIDDAFSLVAAGFTNLPPGQLEMVKPMVKQYTPAVTKIRGTIGSTTKHLVINPALASDDFDYPVPKGVRLIPLPSGAAGRAATAANTAAARTTPQQNACITNLRQIDGAKNQWALEKGKANGTAVTEADITPYLLGGKLPTCPAGGKYTIGKVGERPTCSIAGHALP